MRFSTAMNVTDESYALPSSDTSFKATFHDSYTCSNVKTSKSNGFWRPSSMPFLWLDNDLIN